VKLDKRREDGNELDEFEAHQLIEKVCDDALTVQKMREVLKEIDVDFNKRVSLCEFMIYKYGIDWKELVNAPQGCDMRAINEAQAALDNANAKLQDAIDAASKAKDDAHNSKIAEEKAREEEINSKKAAEDARVAEANLAEAKKQSEAALKELEDQEKAYKDKCDSLEAIGNDASLGVVKKNKAKAELAILKSEDPMPLRMAKIHQEAALRKVTKATVKVSRQIGRELCMRTGIEYRTLWVVLTHKKFYFFYLLAFSMFFLRRLELPPLLLKLLPNSPLKPRMLLNRHTWKQQLQQRSQKKPFPSHNRLFWTRRLFWRK